MIRGAREAAREGLEVGCQFWWGFDFEFDVEHADYQGDQSVGVRTHFEAAGVGVDGGDDAFYSAGELGGGAWTRMTER